jgi:DNA invertase Pin-like site-specific DNA recombinase
VKLADEKLAALDRFAGISDLYGERAHAIKDAFNSGNTISAIARRLGVGRQVVYDAIRNTKGERQ